MEVAAASPALDKVGLEQCRHPIEHRALAITLLVLGCAAVLAVYLRRYDVLLAFAGVWRAMVVTTVQAKTYNRLRGAEVTATQFADIHQMVLEVSRRLGAPPTRTFIIRDPRAEAQSYGFRAPFVLVLHSTLIDALTQEELRSQIGWHLSRITLHHTRVAILLGGDEATLPAVLSWFAWLRDLIFGWYRRLEVMSADRGSILACREVRTPLRALVKLYVGSKQFPEIEENEVIEQAHKAARSTDKLQSTLILLQSPMPPLLLRMQAMVAWGGLPPKPPKGSR